MPRLALFEIAEATIRHPVAARCEGAGCALFIRAPLVMDNRFVEPLAVEAHSAPASHPQLARLPFGRHFLLLAPLAVAPARRRPM